MLYGKLHDMFDDDNVPYIIEKELEKAYECYKRAYSTNNVKHLQDKFTRECIRTMVPSIVNEDRYFPEADYAEVSWELISKEENIVKIKHSLDYKKIKSKGLKIEISQDYSEIWKYNTLNKMVESVTR